MTAAADYPALIDLAETTDSPSVTGEIRRALDEIDLLRAELANLKRQAAPYGPASRSQDERRP